MLTRIAIPGIFNMQQDFYSVRMRAKSVTYLRGVLDKIYDVIIFDSERSCGLAV
jgi:hypothetical protein